MSTARHRSGMPEVLWSSFTGPSCLRRTSTGHRPAEPLWTWGCTSPGALQTGAACTKAHAAGGSTCRLLETRCTTPARPRPVLRGARPVHQGVRPARSGTTLAPQVVLLALEVLGCRQAASVPVCQAQAALLVSILPVVQPMAEPFFRGRAVGSFTTPPPAIKCITAGRVRSGILTLKRSFTLLINFELRDARQGSVQSDLARLVGRMPKVLEKT